MLMKQLIAAICALVILGLGPIAWAQPAVIQFGVLPNVSPRVILTNYQPFRQYLEQELKRPVEVVTAPDFKQFHARTLAGAYDIVVTAANLGRVAQLDAKLPAIAIYEPPIPGVLVMHKSNPVKSVTELRGKTLAMSNPQSLVALKGIHWLQDQGLTAGSDYKTVHTRNEDSLGQLLTSGDAPLAMMSLGEFRAIREDLRQSLEVHQEFVKVPGFFVLLGKPMSEADAAQLRAAILKFPTSDAGKAFFALAGVRDIRPLREADFNSLDPVLAQTRALLDGRQ